MSALTERLLPLVKSNAISNFLHDDGGNELVLFFENGQSLKIRVNNNESLEVEIDQVPQSQHLVEKVYSVEV